MNDSSNNGKSRVLRAKDILPPYDKVIDQGQGGSERRIQQNEEIPKFDLAEQILAEQRKVTATKRKRPANTTETAEKLSQNTIYQSDRKKPLAGIESEVEKPVISAGQTRCLNQGDHFETVTRRQQKACSAPYVFNPLYRQSMQEQIITEIVARDIQRLCRCNLKMPK